MNGVIEQKLNVADVAREARRASRHLSQLSCDVRNQILEQVAIAIEANTEDILAANELDCAAAEAEVIDGRMSRPLLDRLRTNRHGVAAMAEKVRAVITLPDPLGKILLMSDLKPDLRLTKISCPLGVVGVIFESRPDVIPQVGALCFKSGNAVLLKGGREALRTNTLLSGIWSRVLEAANPDLESSVCFLQTREDVASMLKLDGLIDLIVPRGSKEFVAYIARESSIPVLGHGEGICHVYIDEAADLEKAWAISLDAKVDYPAACNSAETLLVHEQISASFLPEMVRRLQSAGVSVRGCNRTRELCEGLPVESAVEVDWATEYSDLCVAVRVVENLDAALAHIDQFGSQHTEAIVTEDPVAARAFLDRVDAAGVYHNVSTRFADGFRYGFGSEVGISTSKLHARGPVGLEGLTTYKYLLEGTGHTVGSNDQLKSR